MPNPYVYDEKERKDQKVESEKEEKKIEIPDYSDMQPKMSASVSMENSNGVRTFAIILLIVVIVGAFIYQSKVSRYYSFINWELFLVVAIPGIVFSAVFFAIASVIDRVNKIIRLLKDSQVDEAKK